MNFEFLLYEFALDYLIKLKICLSLLLKINYKLYCKFYNVLEEDFYLNLESFS